MAIAYTVNTENFKSKNIHGRPRVSLAHIPTDLDCTVYGINSEVTTVPYFGLLILKHYTWAYKQI